MAFSPEFISAVAENLSLVLSDQQSGGARVTQVAGGDTWVALKLSLADRPWLLMSWGSGTAGCCFAGDGDIAALASNSPSRTPMVEALKSRELRGEILSVRQLNHDRVLEFTLCRRIAAGTSLTHLLVLEVPEPVMNFLVLGEDNGTEAVPPHSSPLPDFLPDALARSQVRRESYFCQSMSQALEAGLKSDHDMRDDIGLLVLNLLPLGRPLGRWMLEHWDALRPLSASRVYSTNALAGALSLVSLLYHATICR